jgi:hypothetical protein
MNKDDLQVRYSTKDPVTGEIIESEDPSKIISLHLQNILHGDLPSNERLFDVFRRAVENLRPSLDMLSLAHVTMISHWQGDLPPLKTTREIADLYAPIGKILKSIGEIEAILEDTQDSLEESKQLKLF